MTSAVHDTPFLQLDDCLVVLRLDGHDRAACTAVHSPLTQRSLIGALRPGRTFSAARPGTRWLDGLGSGAGTNPRVLRYLSAST